LTNDAAKTYATLNGLTDATWDEDFAMFMRPWLSGAAALAAVFALSVPFAIAQDEKKTDSKKPEVKKKKTDEDSKEASDEVPTDPRLKKYYDRIKKEAETKFKKGKKGFIYLVSTKETTYEPSSHAAAAGGEPTYDAWVKKEVFRTEDREEGVQKIVKYMMEFPPPDPKAKKGKKGLESATPSPKREWQIESFPKTKAGEGEADAAYDKISRAVERENMAADWQKKEKAKKGQ
jgi:hypothetical protein